MNCKCTDLMCNPCINIVRILDLCPECLFLGHQFTQTASFIHNGKITLKINNKIIKMDGTLK